MVFRYQKVEMHISSSLWVEVGTNDERPKDLWSWVGGAKSGDALRSI